MCHQGTYRGLCPKELGGLAPQYWALSAWWPLTQTQSRETRVESSRGGSGQSHRRHQTEQKQRCWEGQWGSCWGRLGQGGPW